MKKGMMSVVVAVLFLTVVFGGCFEKTDEGEAELEEDINGEEEEEELNLIEGQSFLDIMEPIIIIIDSDTYDQLYPEITRYKEDIIADLGVIVKILAYENPSADIIRSDIEAQYKSDGVSGVILIGEIPTQYFSSSNNPFSEFPSDFYYQDVENTCEYDDTLQVYDYTTCSSSNCNLPKFWIGRITPPINGSEGITLLKSYFDRNHEYRNKNISYNGKMLVYMPIESDIPNAFDEFNETLFDSWEYGQELDMYSKKNVDIVYSDEEYLQKLKQPYDYVFYNGHGNPTWHSQSIAYEDIINTSPKAAYYHLLSCSVGRFTEKNYLTGWYLFTGEALAVTAATHQVFCSPSIDVDEMYLLSNGATFGEARLGANDARHTEFFGDPTLRLRDKVSANSEIFYDKEFIGLFETNYSTEISSTVDIYNQGKTEIKIIKSKIYFDKAYYNLEFGNDRNNITILPGEKHSLWFSVKISNYNGTVDCILSIITDHPKNTIILVPFTIIYN